MRSRAFMPVIAATVVLNQLLAAAAGLCGPRTVAGIMGIAPIRNTGSMLGFGQGHSIWAAVALAGSAASVALARALSGRVDPVALGLLAGGAIANTLQRVTAQGVVDYVALGCRPGIVLNLADVALVAGAYLVMRSFARVGHGAHARP